ncbi:hypothetical protein A1359_20475 [Methylomonas lenta]|uniref:Probable membrane transporter protein n=1 Tax=Methylomonas lenta TaxID=980561 RepID=A0A177NRV2_9GAMM|nr:sulfite exporter TauE/SafE family protein [Methylomonas lenta]MDD2738089.1 sulfite exporter TauE/SafE family protein [Methylomonas lenta]OAI20807.1 hypothetical protein A1359_20475 [Methylomonas lenta]
MLEIFLVSLLLGSLAGISAGLFGIGGGVLIVPFLSWLFAAHQFNPQQIMLIAVATSLATALFTSASSVRTHFYLGNINWPRAFRLGPSLLLGAIGGASLAEYTSANVLRNLFIAYLLYTSLQMALPSKPLLTPKKYFAHLDYPAGFIIGSISAMLGMGGGTMTVPYLAHNGLQMKNAVATSSACAMPIAFSATVSYIFLGWHSTSIVPGSLGYIYLPAFFGIIFTSILTAPVGARLAHRLPAQRLKRYFSCLLLLIALKMIW